MSTAAFVIWSARETARLDVLIASKVEVTFRRQRYPGTRKTIRRPSILVRQ